MSNMTSHVLRGLALAVSLSLAGCLAQGSDEGELGKRDQDVGTAQTDGTGAASGASTESDGPALQRGGATETRPGCNSCGQPIPWTPPNGSLKPDAVPAGQEPAPPPEPDHEK